MALERKHKTIMQFGNAMADSSRNYGGSVLREVVNKALSYFDNAQWLNMSVGLVDPKQPPLKLTQWLKDTFGSDGTYRSAFSARINEFEKVQTGDIVAVSEHRGWIVARILFLASSSGVAFAALSPLQRAENGVYHSVWRHADQLPFVRVLQDISAVLIYNTSGCVTTVIHPLALQC